MTDETCRYCGVQGGVDLFSHTVGSSIDAERRWDHELCESQNEACIYAFFVGLYEGTALVTRCLSIDGLIHRPLATYPCSADTACGRQLWCSYFWTETARGERSPEVEAVTRGAAKVRAMFPPWSMSVTKNSQAAISSAPAATGPDLPLQGVHLCADASEFLGSLRPVAVQLGDFPEGAGRALGGGQEALVDGVQVLLQARQVRDGGAPAESVLDAGHPPLGPEVDQAEQPAQHGGHGGGHAPGRGELHEEVHSAPILPAPPTGRARPAKGRQPRRQSEFTTEYLARARTRFLALVEERDGHWAWVGSPSSNGRHGWFRFGNAYNAVAAHRAAWLLWRGDLPPAPRVVASCAQDLCVRPEHLQDVDGVEWARQPRWRPISRGEASPHSKLTERRVREIHRLYRNGWLIRQLAARFGVTKGLVSHITSGRAWPHLGLTPLRRVGGVTVEASELLRGSGPPTLAKNPVVPLTRRAR